MTIYSDALIARNRLLEELFRVEDYETAKTLWRAAKRYNRLANDAERQALESGLPPLANGTRGGHVTLSDW